MTVCSVLPKGPEAAAEARRALDQLAGRLTAEKLETARLLVTEVVTNAVRHVDRDGVISLRLHVDRERVRVEVQDPGGGFELKRRGPDAPLDGKWGLHFLEVLSDGWGMDCDETNRVWFELAREPALSAA
jgi:anti-sigma regulatory factor (Ser/Thr protein kinase)